MSKTKNDIYTNIKLFKMPVIWHIAEEYIFVSSLEASQSASKEVYPYPTGIVQCCPDKQFQLSQIGAYNSPGTNKHSTKLPMPFDAF